MPALIAVLVRQLIMTIIQVGAWIGVEKVLTGLIDKAKKRNVEELGLSEEDAESHAANTVIEIAIAAGVTLLMLRTKLPAKVADKLGFSTKGFQKRKLSQAGEAKLKPQKIPSATTSKVSPDAVEEISQAVASSRGRSVTIVRSLFNDILKVAAVTTGVFFAAAQYIDFANWQGPYQKTFQKLLGAFGLNPDTALPKAGAVSDDIWKKLYTVVEELNPKTVSFPFSDQVKPYSRANLADLVNEVAAGILKDGGSASFKNVWAIVLPLISIGGASSSPSKSTTTSSPTSSSGITNLSQYYASIGQSLPSVSARSKIYEQMGLGQAAFYTGTAEQNTKLLQALLGKRTTSTTGAVKINAEDDAPKGTKVERIDGQLYMFPSTPAPTLAPTGTKNVPVVPAPSTQVFMGVVAGGTLSNNVVFSERPDDLIESFDEFQAAAANNLSSFLLALTNRISYELKIVPSVVSAGGFRQTGTTNRYITGYNKDGSPKYKTVTNKFATLTIYILNDKNARTKIGTIVLGPTDSSKITPTQTDLRQLEAVIQNSIVTRNIDDISRIETSTPTTIVPPTGDTNGQGGTTTPPTGGSGLEVKIPASQLSFFGGVIPEGASWSRDEGVFIKRNGIFVREGDGAILVEE